MTGSPRFLPALALPIILSGTAIPQAVRAQSALPATIEVLIGHAETDSEGGALLDVRLLNTGAAAAEASLPAVVEARVTRPGAFGEGRTVTLQREASAPASVAVAPGRFTTVRYRLAGGSLAESAQLSVPGWGGQAVSLAVQSPAPNPTPNPAPEGGPPWHPGPHVALAAPPPPPAAMPLPPTPPPSDRTVGNAYIGNLSAYEPTYAVYGPGTNSDARLQLSFKYQLFGSRAHEGGRALADGLYFAYTQRMFWDLGANSSPFRNIDFQPEAFYVSAPKVLSDKATLSAQVGVRHESNGRDGDDSRSMNTIYLAPMAAFTLADDLRLTVQPRVWLFVGDLSDNPDIRRYRGNSGISFQIGRENGWRFSSLSRFSFSSGKGSTSGELSYPLRRLLGGGPDFYLFGQGFVGYGENLLDYNRRTTRLRLGVALVR